MPLRLWQVICNKSRHAPWLACRNSTQCYCRIERVSCSNARQYSSCYWSSYLVAAHAYSPSSMIPCSLSWMKVTLHLVSHVRTAGESWPEMLWACIARVASDLDFSIFLITWMSACTSSLAEDPAGGTTADASTLYNTVLSSRVHIYYNLAFQGDCKVGLRHACDVARCSQCI